MKRWNIFNIELWGNRPKWRIRFIGRDVAKKRRYHTYPVWYPDYSSRETLLERNTY